MLIEPLHVSAMDRPAKSGPVVSNSSGVNQRLVQNFLALLGSFCEPDRQAIIAAIQALPKENSPTPPMAGWLEQQKPGQEADILSRSQLVDYCKRIEWVYSEFMRQHRKLSRTPFIDFRTTEALVKEILSQGGTSALSAYVEHLEKLFAHEKWSGFDRPERMREHWLSYSQQG